MKLLRVPKINLIMNTAKNGLRIVILLSLMDALNVYNIVYFNVLGLLIQPINVVKDERVKNILQAENDKCGCP